MTVRLTSGAPLVAGYLSFAGGTGVNTITLDAANQYGIGVTIDSFLAGTQEDLLRPGGGNRLETTPWASRVSSVRIGKTGRRRLPA